MSLRSRNNWWCLSSNAGNSTNFCNVNNNGNPNNNSAANTWVGAPVGFRQTARQSKRIMRGNQCQTGRRK